MLSRTSGDHGRRKRGPAQIPSVEVDLEALHDPLMVSALSEVPNRHGRFRVSVNGADVGDVTLDFVAEAGIREGNVITRHQAVEVIAAANRTAVLDKALDLLAVRARSARDLRIRLRRAGADDSAISWTVDRLSAQGFVDDGAYARQVARAKVLTGGVSRRKVVTALRRRGVAADVADEAVQATLQEVNLDEAGAALEAARKRLRALGSLEPAKRRQRLYAFLARRGYNNDVVRRVLAEVLR